MSLEGEVDNVNLAVICHSYNNFQKDPIDILAPRVSSVNVFVRVNPFSELGKYLSIPQLERFSSAYKIDLTGTPENVQVSPTPIWYLPTDRDYKRLGERHYAHVKSLIKERGTKFDLIHAHFTWSAGYAGARLKEEYDVPFVVTGHGYDIYSLPFKDDEWRAKIEYVLNTADHIITVSQSNLACIQKLDVSTPVTVIPNGFRSDLFYPRDSLECRKALNLPQDKKIILTVGNLEPVKGQRYLVEAVQRIIRERKNILCVIVGAGKVRTALERQIRSLGLEDYILLAGGKPHDEIPLWMNACDLFVLPSLRESFGVVQIEAMACGKPVVATRNGGSEEVVISDKYGLLVEPADPEDLAEKILVALDREWDREAILAYAERFTWENIVKDILKIYRSLGIGD
ncbi:glycosyltransferase family 4 protein [Methanoculleus thermophilus]|uniref:Glycosyltransferase involved in cell wall bisynthesis n=1 Tax=Methanoculleus thermophilus TaxID=2200 RepID=A0A1G9CI61_9EURY|nr:glycosyltransferase family 4 protein [Methanoculleus thermophilus]SDK51095.1 Glycosyltransferase involved in cell wall bisynthesis [Methanoculleus thermophilus]